MNLLSVSQLLQVTFRSSSGAPSRCSVWWSKLTPHRVQQERKLSKLLPTQGCEGTAGGTVQGDGEDLRGAEGPEQSFVPHRCSECGKSCSSNHYAASPDLLWALCTGKNKFPIWYKQNLLAFLGESLLKASACELCLSLGPIKSIMSSPWGPDSILPSGPALWPCCILCALLHCLPFWTALHEAEGCALMVLGQMMGDFSMSWWHPKSCLVSCGSGPGCAKVSPLYSIKIKDSLHTTTVNVKTSDLKAEQWAITGEKNPWDMVLFPRAWLCFPEGILICIHFFSSSCGARLFQNAPEKVNSCESGRWSNHWVQAESFPQTYLFLEERKRHPKRKWEVMSYRNHFFHWLAPTQGLSAMKTKFVINSFPKLTCK